MERKCTVVTVVIISTQTATKCLSLRQLMIQRRLNIVIDGHLGRADEEHLGLRTN